MPLSDLMFATRPSRVANLAAHLAKRPTETGMWLKERLQPRTPLESRVPWLSYGAINHLKRYVRPSMRVFEWGGGGSTMFFLDLGCEVRCVETHDGWASSLRETADALPSHLSKNLSIRLRPIDGGGQDQIQAFMDEIADGGPWDVILVDFSEQPGLSRVDAAASAKAHLSSEGMLILDDAWRPEYRSAREQLLPLKQHRFLGLGPGRIGVTRTDIYCR